MKHNITFIVGFLMLVLYVYYAFIFILTHFFLFIKIRNSVNVMLHKIK